MSEDQAVENAQLIAAFEDSIKDYISPKNIRRIRQKYRISQAEAGEIFQCGSSYFSKWERGEAAPTGTAAVALRSALKHPEVMQHMAADAGVTISIPEKPLASTATQPVTQEVRHGESIGRLLAPYVRHVHTPLFEVLNSPVLAEKSPPPRKASKALTEGVTPVVYELKGERLIVAAITREQTELECDIVEYFKESMTALRSYLAESDAPQQTSVETNVLSDWAGVVLNDKNFAIPTPGSS
jgi:DNA-binding transcriptional regulator YiaG